MLHASSSEKGRWACLGHAIWPALHPVGESDRGWRVARWSNGVCAREWRSVRRHTKRARQELVSAVLTATRAPSRVRSLGGGGLSLVWTGLPRWAGRGMVRE